MKIHSVQRVPTLLVNDEKLKDPTDVANAFHNFFITITEKLNNLQIQQNGDDNSVLKKFISWRFPKIKIIPITEDEIKSILHSQKPKKSSGYDEITSEILKACVYLVNRPLSYIYIHLYTGTCLTILKLQ